MMLKLILTFVLVLLPTVTHAIDTERLGDIPVGDAVVITANVIDAGGVATKASGTLTASIQCESGGTWTVQQRNLAMTINETITTGTADSGTTSTMVDAALTQVDDYWNKYVLRWTSGSNINREAVVTSFVAATDTITFVPTMSYAVTNTDTYELLNPRYSATWTVSGPSSGDVCAGEVVDTGSNDVVVVKRFTFKVSDQWPIFNVVDATNEGGDQDPTTTSFDTDYTDTIDRTGSDVWLYFPRTDEDSRQSANCNVQGLTVIMTGFNTTTKVATVTLTGGGNMPAAPDYRCVFRENG